MRQIILLTKAVFIDQFSLSHLCIHRPHLVFHVDFAEVIK